MKFAVPSGMMMAGMLAVAALSPGAYASVPSRSEPAFVEPFNTVTTIASTVPANGDLNPYGTAVVPKSKDLLHRGDVLVSNFNNAQNLQGTGTTIVEISPKGEQRLFAQIDPHNLPGACPGGVGLTTALVALRSGWVIVGSLPTADGTSATAQAGCLLVLDSKGQVRETFSGDGINGPWDMTARDRGESTELFVTNVLNGTVAGGGSVVNGGTVLRLSLKIDDENNPPKLCNVTEIGSGFGERTDPTALVLGPTGVGLSGDTLFVADTVGNRITAIPDATERDDSAGTGRTVTQNEHLSGPLGMAIAPNGHILTVNGGDGNLVETTPEGEQVAVKTLDSSGTPPGAGTLFGVAVAPDHRGVYFVDDGTNTLNLLH